MNYSTEVLSGLMALSLLVTLLLGNRLRQRNQQLQSIEATQADLQVNRQSISQDNQKLKKALDLAKQTIEALQEQIQTLADRETTLSADLNQAQKHEQQQRYDNRHLHQTLAAFVSDSGPATE